MKSTAEKVGQMLMSGFDGLTAPDYFLNWLREGRLGGVILFARNVDTPQQLAALTASLQDAAKYPLLIAIDQEGGTVARLRAGFSESPGALALSSIANNPEQHIETVSGVLGAEMRALGINWTYAPVLDVNYNADNPTLGTRSFGTDPESIAELAGAAIRGFQGDGVAACAKHFPGLGNTDVDTHLALPRLSTSLEQLRTVDLLPYRAAIDNNLATVMTTHTIYSVLDEEHPATLSETIVPQILREELGFEGVVTTDCMEMKAIDDHYGVQDSVVRAALAGIDIILFSHTAEKQAAAYESLLEAVENGRVPMDLVDRANERIAALKEKFPSQTPDISTIYSAQHQTTMLEAAKTSIGLVRAQNGILPLTAEQAITLVEFSPAVDSIVQESTDSSTLSYYLKQELPHIQTHVLPSRSTEQPTIETDILVIATRNAHLIPSQTDAVQALAQQAKTVILVALRNPYDAKLLPEGTVLCSSGDSRPSLMAISAALRGEFIPSGTVTL